MEQVNFEVLEGCPGGKVKQPLKDQSLGWGLGCLGLINAGLSSPGPACRSHLPSGVLPGGGAGGEARREPSVLHES